MNGIGKWLSVKVLFPVAAVGVALVGFDVEDDVGRDLEEEGDIEDGFTLWAVVAGLVAMTSVVDLVVVDLRMEVVLEASLGCWVVEVTFSPQANSRDEAKSIISNFGIVRGFMGTNI